MTTGSILARTNASDWSLDFQRDYGNTDIVLNGQGFSSTEASDIDAAGGATPLPDGSTTREYLWTSTAITSLTEYENNKVWYVQFGNMAFSDTDATAGIRIVDGHAPRMSGECCSVRTSPSGSVSASATSSRSHAHPAPGSSRGSARSAATTPPIQ